MPVAATLSHTHHTPEQIILRQKHIMQAEEHQNRLPAVEVQMRFLYLSYLLVNPGRDCNNRGFSLALLQQAKPTGWECQAFLSRSTSQVNRLRSHPIIVTFEYNLSG